MLFLRRPTADSDPGVPGGAGPARSDLLGGGGDGRRSRLPVTSWTTPASSSVTGEKVFAAAKAALERWQQFRLGWLEASPEDTPIKEGQVVAILARSIGLWWLNACRIVVVINEDGPVQALRLRLRHAAGPCRERRGALPGRVGPGRRQRVVRHPGLLPASAFPGAARLPLGAAGAEAIRPRVGCGHAEGCGGGRRRSLVKSECWLVATC